MFKTIKEALAFIESQRVKRSFEDFQKIVDKYHFNVNLKNVIHVAGTNGKGSTVTFIKDLLIKQGYHVGTFTSPYIIKHNERIAVDGKPISDLDLLRLINQLYPVIEKEHLSMFEIDTLIMLSYFNELDLDYHVIECGIGGLNDKTNVIQSKIAVITNIGYDHQFMLGNTLLEIACHKAGIIKEGVPLFTTEKNQEILAYFQKVCKEKQSAFYHVKALSNHRYPYQITFEENKYQLYLPSYQIDNLLLALNVVSSLISLKKEEIQSVIDHFMWPCRFEQFGSIYLDGAHNINGIMALIETIKERNLEDVGIVFSSLMDKDGTKMLELLKDYDVMLADFEDERSQGGHLPYQEAISIMKEKHKNVVVTGSLHFVSTVRKYVISA